MVENQSCIQNRITQHLQLTGWKSLLVFILLLESYCRKHNARDENHDDSTKPFRKINATKNTVFYCIYQLCRKMTQRFWSFRAYRYNSCFTRINAKEELVKSMMDVVSHEFFHIVTPLSIHSKEIQDFDYNDPKMSEHLWMYEGVTEYFANLFQINQGLITEEDFTIAFQTKWSAHAMNDTMSFTTMSANVLKQPYKDQYINVYQRVIDRNVFGYYY
jgi:hypothetical protein